MYNFLYVVDAFM